ncbi:MAG: VWD domain-containing protein, partial [Acidimicrobiales bacterium]
DGGGGGGSGGGGSGGGGGGGGSGSSKHDPHITTFTGYRYSFQVIGEFLAARAGDLEVQARYEPLACACEASIGTAVAVGHGDNRVVVTLADRRLVTIDDEQVDVAEAREVSAGALVVRRTTMGVEISDDDGNRVKVALSPQSISLYLDQGPDTEWTGIFGDGRDERGDDLRYQDGSPVGPTPDQETIQGAFADSWRLDPADSLFDYGPGESTEGFATAEYPAPHPTASPEELAAERQQRSAQAETVCRLAGILDPELLEDCTFDFTVTGSPAMVQGTRHSDLIEGTGRSGGAAGTSTSSSGTTIPDATLNEIRGGDLARGDGLVLVRTTAADGVDRLHAIDLDSMTERWVADDVEPRCRPVVVESVAVVAQLAAGSPRLGDDPDALVLLSLEDGSELDRWVPAGDERLGRCVEALAVDGDVVVHSWDKVIRGFQVGESIEPIWSTQLEVTPAPGLPIVDGHVVVARRGDAQVVYEALALDSGASTSTAELFGHAPVSTRAVGDGLLAVTISGTIDLPAVVGLLEADGGELQVRWAQAYGPDDLRPPLQLARLGDLLIGWADLGDDNLVAFSLADGEIEWSHRASSFDNTVGLVAAGDAVALVSPFGGAWLELIDPEGEVVELRDHPEDYSGAAQITVLDDQTVIVSGVVGDGVYVERVTL